MFRPVFNLNNGNAEIIYKLLKAAAKKWDCKVEYNPAACTIRFIGPLEMQRAITEEVIDYFRKASE